MATDLTSRLTRGKLADMSETPHTAPADVFQKTRDHDRRELIEFARREDLIPYFRVLESEAGPVVRMEGRERLMLGSNNYLGLTGDERVKAAAREALERYGTALTGSRLMNGTIPLHRELEEEIAGWLGTEDALVFTTGYQANVGCLSGVLSDPLDEENELWLLLGAVLEVDGTPVRVSSLPLVLVQHDLESLDPPIVEAAGGVDRERVTPRDDGRPVQPDVVVVVLALGHHRKYRRVVTHA